MKKGKPTPFDIESFIICPNCSHRITKKTKGFFCRNCKSHYPYVKSIPLLIKIEDHHKLNEADYNSSVSKIYRQLHQLGSYRNTYFHLRSLKPILGLDANSKVLELGCGTGYDAGFLFQKGLIVVETDISVGQVLEAKKQLAKRGFMNSNFFYVADAENIPFADESFNATFITATLHHLEHPVKALSEMRRCTEKGGIIVIAMEPNRYEWILVIGFGFSIMKKILLTVLGKRFAKKLKARTKDWREPNIEKTFSKKEILTLVKKAGLNPQKIKGIWFTCGFIHWVITLLNKTTKKTWYLNKDIEEFLVLFDDLIARVPLINHFACNWTLFCKRD
ncbi:methyltransferase domain-containing protein [candidate division WOR-3 bacterium]|nr:methyltransferase domain-containing protein [candidate division WOR-3 bacterium]